MIEMELFSVAFSHHKQDGISLGSTYVGRDFRGVRRVHRPIAPQTVREYHQWPLSFTARQWGDGEARNLRVVKVP